MPKIIELTVEIEIQKVTCPGVWLCQDGGVSLTVFALGTSYQTCTLPPVFPLLFKDVFYFKKRYKESCALNNICCILKDETIYCELIQQSEQHTCGTVVLAQYLGTLNDVLFPPNLCTSDGVDLLMRRSREFPGILAPKIEIATKVRLDEIWKNKSGPNSKANKCACPSQDENMRQKQVCHSPQYHRVKCNVKKKAPSRSRSRSGSRSCCSLSQKSDNNTAKADCSCSTNESTAPEIDPNTVASSCRRSRCPSRQPSRQPSASKEYSVYNVELPDVRCAWRNVTHDGRACNRSKECYKQEKELEYENLDILCEEDKLSKSVIASRYIEPPSTKHDIAKKMKKFEIQPCICEICKKYYELFHMNACH